MLRFGIQLATFRLTDNEKKAKTRCCCVNLVNNVKCPDQLLIYNICFELLCRITNIWIFQLDLLGKMFSKYLKKLGLSTCILTTV